jgi:hypothetical protein
VSSGLPQPPHNLTLAALSYEQALHFTKQFRRKQYRRADRRGSYRAGQAEADEAQAVLSCWSWSELATRRARRRHLEQAESLLRGVGKDVLKLERCAGLPLSRGEREVAARFNGAIDRVQTTMNPL